MEALSSTAAWLGFAASGAASVLYLVHALGLRVVTRRLATEAGEGPALTMIEQGSGAGAAGWAGRAATALSWATFALLVVSLAARWAAVEHAPWSNMYEFTVAFATAILGFYLVFERFYTRPGTVEDAESRPARALGAVALPVVAGMLAIALAFFPDDVHPLVPALQNADLLAIHVAAMILAYAALSVSFAAAVLYLVQGEGQRFQRLPPRRTLDEIALKSVMVGFPLLAAGIALGAYWADSAWGRYWGWDPKETSALVTLLIYATYLHTHSLRSWAGARSAWVLIIGFTAVLFTYFVVNLWVSGLHSYAGV
jgi:cytochrome c-type biogenesis protein CcsB